MSDNFPPEVENMFDDYSGEPEPPPNFFENEEFGKPAEPTNQILKNSRWTVRSASEALLPQPPIDYLIDRLIIRRSVNLFYGDPGSKKTYSLMHLGVCLSMGIKWLNFETKQAKVLLIDEESGDTRVLRRLGEIMRGEVSEASIPFQFVSLAGFKLDNKADQACLEGLIAETGAELVIIDALTDVMDGDENTKQDTQPVFNALRKIADRTNAAIIVIHHSGKSGDYRGSSAIKGALDLMVKVVSEEGSNIVDFKTEKNRDGEEIRFSAIAKWENDQFTLTATEREITAYGREPEKYVLRFLQEHTSGTIEEIQAAADTCSSRAAKDAVYRLARDGKIKRINPHAKIGEKAIYEISA